jgi:hypothetical protein
MGDVLEPNISNVDPAVLAYWQVRMGQAGHPMLKARYADLLWDLSRRPALPGHTSIPRGWRPIPM